MKKNKKTFSFNSIVICSLIVSVVSISNANAARKGQPGSNTRVDWCANKMQDCIDDIEDACGEGTDVGTRLCESSETTACNEAYGSASDCETRPRIIEDLDRSALGAQDVYMAPDDNDGNKGFDKNTFVPKSNFVVAPPTDKNGTSRLPKGSAAPVINKSLVVPTKKTNTKPTILQPKIRMMNVPSISTKQRVEAPIPATSSRNKPSSKKIDPARSKGIKHKAVKPPVREMNKVPVINNGMQKTGAATKHFDEADSIFGKRDEPGTTK